MTNEQKFQECLVVAERIVAEHRLMAPIDMDPQCVFTTTALLMTALIASVLGTGVSAYGAYAQGQAASDSAKYNAKVSQNAATAATQQAQFDANQIADRNKRVLASQRAIFSASGIKADSGSTVDVGNDSKYQGEMERLMALYTGRSTATSYASQSQLDRATGKNALTSSYINMGSTVLTGAGDAAQIGGKISNPTF